VGKYRLTGHGGRAIFGVMNDTKVVRVRRRIHTRDPLLLVGPPQDAGAAAYAVATAICDNPQCTCTRMWLAIRPAQRGADGLFEIRGPVLGGEVAADGTDLKLEADTTGVFSAMVTAWLHVQLSQDDHRAWLRERWRRVRGQIGDPAYPPAVLPPRGDWMTSFGEVFPYDFDLTAVHDRHLYWADDQYCLEPACTCDEVGVSFVDVSAGESLGYARASVRRLRTVAIEGPPVIQQLWTALLDQHGPQPLRERFRRMRAVARSRATSPSPGAQSPVGRNALCPCGSGLKFKRCCGSSAGRAPRTPSPPW
jgi:hypothetical protein